MSFIRRNGETAPIYKEMFGGPGEAEMHRILLGADEMSGKGRLFNHIVLHPAAASAGMYTTATARHITFFAARASITTTVLSSRSARETSPSLLPARGTASETPARAIWNSSHLFFINKRNCELDNRFPGIDYCIISTNSNSAIDFQESYR